MNFREFYNQEESFEKPNSLTQEEIQILKNYGFQISKNKKSAVKKYEDFYVDVYSDTKQTTMVLKLADTQPEVELSSTKNKYLTDKIVQNFLNLVEEKIKNYKEI